MSFPQVVIPVFGQFEIALEVIMRAIKHTPSQVVINVIDDGSPDGKEFEKLLIENQLIGRIKFKRNSSNQGFVKTMNDAFAVCHPDDVIILNSDCYVSIGWYDNLISTASSSDLVATVTAMSDNGSISEVTLGSERIEITSLDELDRINREMPKNTSDFLVQIPVGVGHCMWISRKSLEIVGYFDEIFSPGYGEEVDFCLRATRMGFHHLLCKNTLVHHAGGASFSERTSKLQSAHERILRSRYPFFHSYASEMTVRSSESEAAFMNVLISTRPLKLLLDCRMASAPLTGTSRFCVELARAVINDQSCETKLLVRDSAVHDFAEIFDPNRVISEKLVENYVVKNNRFDVVFRIGQVGNRETLESLWFFAFKVGILQLDFIAADNFAYFENANHYLEFYDATRAALNMCDSVVYLSKTVMHEAKRYGPDRAPGAWSVTNCGIDHVPSNDPSFQSGEGIIVLGAAFAHKNREWAIKIMAKLIEAGHSDLKVYLVGPTPTSGESTSTDKKLIQRLGIEGNVEIIEWISDRDLDELLKNCAMSVSCSVSEGFGMVPLELAMKGVVPVSYHGSAFSEHSGALPYFLGMTDLNEDVKIVQKLLVDDLARKEQMLQAMTMADSFRWEFAAQSLVDSAFRAARAPSTVYWGMRREYFRSAGSKTKLIVSFMMCLRNTKPLLLIFPPGKVRTAKFARLVLKLVKI